jgi:hypothetical protein
MPFVKVDLSVILPSRFLSLSRADRNGYLHLCFIELEGFASGDRTASSIHGLPRTVNSPLSNLLTDLQFGLLLWEVLASMVQ